MSDLGYFKDYGWLIISFCIMFYITLYIYLSNENGEISDE